ncbi:C1 family peptidase [Sphingomonas sp. HF-S4]|uniref:C1 family peptidase n=1 Tax=Sphingomonas agrestis TaxID=3080540 RepID=A0ABU3Y5T6_9SPHN|nr:C1 family peptidase [Sphingomonas sp. HF-S4]MDV3456686.1 C1 family peptidase [Sphingomonas sp. HF-S4]
MPILSKLDALPDTVDFRDAMYRPSLIRVPEEAKLEAYRKRSVPILDQGGEGACTGFALATVANYLLRARGENPDAEEVSAYMLYAMARRYDEWPGEAYVGSSVRGAVKAWHKHGVCAKRLWKDITGQWPSDEAAADAITRPLGAYYRVNHRDLVAMHAAISEVGVLLASADIHAGWGEVSLGEPHIPFVPGRVGGHAFAIVGYDQKGFWIQNSWGEDWGDGGFARLGYDDWLANGSDIWVASLGVPVHLGQPSASAELRTWAPQSLPAYVYSALRPHIVTARNDGVLDDKGEYGLTREGLNDVITRQMPKCMETWARKRVMLYAHGGLVRQSDAIQVVAANRQAALDAEVYPLAFIWRSDALSTIRNILAEALSSRRDESMIGGVFDFLLDRVDDMLEPVARRFGGKAMWDEMKENAFGATRKEAGAARLTADLLIGMYQNKQIDEIHLVGHSAGSIFHAELAQYFADAGVPIASVSLLAPACTIDLFDRCYRPLIEDGRIDRFGLYTMDDATERDDHCAHIYNKSLLYLVSAAFEETIRANGGEPLLGLARFVRGRLDDLWDGQRIEWIVAPSNPASAARSHGGFDNDKATLLSTLARIRDERDLMIAGLASLPQIESIPTSTPASRARMRRQLERVADLRR